MISSFDYYKQVENPDMYLCNPDKRFLCALDSDDRHLILRFNDLSELTFTIPKIKGRENEYDLIESKRLVFIDKIGWFQIVDAKETLDGNKCTKSITAQSLQSVFKNRGFVTEERLYMFYNPNDPRDDKYDSNNKKAIPSVVGQLYKQLGIEVTLSMKDFEPTQESENWKIVYIDPELYFNAKSYGEMYEQDETKKSVCRGFEANKELNGYDFIINQVEKAFNVVFEFDYLHCTIKVKLLENITKPTNIYLSLENVVNTLNITENAEDIVTIMDCNGKDVDIRTVNPMGTNYIANFDYYKKVKSDNGVEYPWMSKELIEALNSWEDEFKKWQEDDENRGEHKKSYSTLVKDIQSLYLQNSQLREEIEYANLKLTDMQTARDQFLMEEDKELEGEGRITAENVDVGDNSLLTNSKFYKEVFTDEVSITGHIKAPFSTKIENTPQEDSDNKKKYYYEFSFSDEGVKGTPKSLIENFIDTEDEDVQSSLLYFMDEDKRSYCKLQVSSKIGVVKDDDGNISQDGTVAIGDIQFTVSKSKDVYVITSEDGKLYNCTKLAPYFTHDGMRYRVTESSDNIVSVYCYYIAGFERVTTYAETVGDDGWCAIWEHYIQTNLIPRQTELEKEIKVIEKEMEYISDLCNIEKFVKRQGDALYRELTNYWIEGEYSNDNIAAFNSTTIAERIEYAKELMDAGKKDLEKCSQPQYEVSIDTINFIKMYEFRQFTQELELGRVITIEKNDDEFFQLALMTIEYDIDTADSFSMTFSNASKPDETAMTFADLLKSSSSTTRKVSSNWSNLMDYSNNKEEITRLIEAPLDRSLRAMQANLASQAFIVDDKGILGRKYDTDSDGANGTFLPEQIRIINNTIMFTEDNWETAALALGKTDHGYGLVASVLVGELILGEQISIGSNSERVRINDNGILIKNNNKQAVFEAKKDGNLVITGTIHATDGDFTGTIYATDGEFNGKITATEGKIGGYTIGKTSLNGATVGMSSDNAKNAIVFWAGENKENKEKSPFYVTNNGELYASNAVVKGIINADSGTISSFNIANDNIEAINRSIVIDATNGKLDAKSVQIEDILYCGNIQANKILNSSANAGFDFLFSTKDTVEIEVDMKLEQYAENNKTFYKAILTTSSPLNVSVEFSIKIGYHLYIPGGSGAPTSKFNYRYYKTKIDMGSESAIVYNIPPTNGSQGILYNYNIETYASSVTPNKFNQLSKDTSINIGVTGGLFPTETLKYDLGSEEFAWKGMVIQTDPIVISDKNCKHNIEPLCGKHDILFNELKPVSFVYNQNDSGRTHFGLLAQNLMEAIQKAGLSTTECGAYVEEHFSNGEVLRGIRYGELIALNIYEIQKLKEKIAALETQLLDVKK